MKITNEQMLEVVAGIFACDAVPAELADVDELTLEGAAWRGWLVGVVLAGATVENITALFHNAGELEALRAVLSTAASG